MGPPMLARFAFAATGLFGGILLVSGTIRFAAWLNGLVLAPQLAVCLTILSLVVGVAGMLYGWDVAEELKAALPKPLPPSRDHPERQGERNEE